MPSSSATTDIDISLSELAQFRIFRGLPDEKLSKIRDIIRVARFDRGAQVIRDGDVGETLYLLLDGEVEVTKMLVMRMSRQEVDQTDKSLIRLSSTAHPEYGKPIFGEMALYSDHSRRTATVTATKPSLLGVIHRDPFFELCEAEMEIGYRISSAVACMLSERLDKATQDVLNLTTALSFVLTSR